MRLFHAAAALAASSLTAAAQPTQIACGPRPAIVALLAEVYREHPVGLGATGGGALAELFRSDAGTWSLVVTPAGGLSCILMGGDGWETLPPIVEGTDS